MEEWYVQCSSHATLNNWNLQVWNNQQLPDLDIPPPNKSLKYNPKYLLVRSEDFVNSRWQVLQALHQFVDSSLPLKDFCCQSDQKDKDLGESVHFAEKSKYRGPQRRLLSWGG